MPKDIAPSTAHAVTFRKPDDTDGPAIWALIRACPPLDRNSLYCNLLQCGHFRDTCVVAEIDGRLAGWVSAYLPPAADDTLFVWQVAVADHARGRGLGGRMLKAILTRPECRGVTQLQTTITADNAASWALFTRFAERSGAALDSAPHFTADDHFRGAHATEHMVTIRLARPMRLAA